MIDLSTYPDEIMLARGQYSTVRHAHESQIDTLRKVFDNMRTQINIMFAEATSAEPDSKIITEASEKIQLCWVAATCVADDLVASAQQKKDLRPIAYPS